jgi:hypothetical protein|tara:strand:+ start:360 stop:641 length:282 start_codon:yes stop_codon:yes gene_type:complete
MRPKEILLKAAELVGGKRAEQHGDYRLLHVRIADLWSSYLGKKISPKQVAFCMTMLKVARDEQGVFNPDDGADATAYTGIWAALAADYGNDDV